MSLTVNDVYEHFQKLIASDSTLNLVSKEIAFNEGYLYLLERMIYLATGIDELLVSTPENLTGTISQNYVTLPSSFFALQLLWKKSGTQHLKFEKEANVSFDKLTDQAGPGYFVTTNTGLPSLFSVIKPKLFFDKYFSATVADAMKITYWQMPDEVDFYDTITLTDVTGTFEAGNTITGGRTQATGIITTVGVNSLNLASESITLALSVGEPIEGVTPLDTGVISSISQKPQTLELSRDYKNLLATAIATIYLTMRRMNEEAAAKSQTLDNLIKMRGCTNKNKQSLKVGIRRWPS